MRNLRIAIATLTMSQRQDFQLQMFDLFVSNALKEADINAHPLKVDFSHKKGWLVWGGYIKPEAERWITIWYDNQWCIKAVGADYRVTSAQNRDLSQALMAMKKMLG